MSKKFNVIKKNNTFYLNSFIYFYLFLLKLFKIFNRS